MSRDTFGSLKPMCQTCLRRVYGMAKGDGGWWCSNCEAWVVKPKPKLRKKSGDPHGE